jgi:hypothetical protein
MRTDMARLTALACYARMNAARTVLLSQLARFRRTGEGALLEDALQGYRQAKSRWEREDNHTLVLIQEEVMASKSRLAAINGDGV